ncbi:hypothetical protein FISHEDRAFT_57678 [Fistulina hepatica ATCC 64428]|uniref:Secreted protein n=1 Tax=Fistulina hepatica ATCC 64428 TaxID=1128425 RepID=A0A0D7AG18_9AGAR|nr:hypothetical protein FISHEDRAFT_57678 [Fistulina hepatica ATCC 64428]
MRFQWLLYLLVLLQAISVSFVCGVPVDKDKEHLNKPLPSLPSGSSSGSASQSSQDTTFGDLVFDEVGPALNVVKAVGGLAPGLLQAANLASLLWDHVKAVKSNNAELQHLSTDAARLVKVMAEMDRRNPMRTSCKPLTELLEEIYKFVQKKIPRAATGSKAALQQAKNLALGGHTSREIQAYHEKLAHECSMFSIECAIRGSEQAMQIHVVQKEILKNQQQILANQQAMMGQKSKHGANEH